VIKGTPALFNLQDDEVQLLKAKSKNSELIKLGVNVEEVKKESHSDLTHTYPTEYRLTTKKAAFVLKDINGVLLPTHEMDTFIAVIFNYPSGVLRIVFKAKKMICTKQRKAKFDIRLGTTDNKEVFAIVTGVDGQLTDDNSVKPNIQLLQKRHNVITAAVDNAFKNKSGYETDEDSDEGVESWAEQVENNLENQVTSESNPFLTSLNNVIVNEKTSKAGLEVNPSELHLCEGAKPKIKKSKLDTIHKPTRCNSSDLQQKKVDLEKRNYIDFDRRSSISSTNFSSTSVKLKPANLNDDLAKKKGRQQGNQCDIDDRRFSIQSLGTQGSIKIDYEKFDNDSISETSSQLSQMKMSGWKTSSGGQMKVENKKFQIIDWLEDKQSSTVDRTQEIQEVEVVVRAKICLQPGEQLMAINNFDASLMILNKNK